MRHQWRIWMKANKAKRTLASDLDEPTAGNLSMGSDLKPKIGGGSNRVTIRNAFFAPPEEEAETTN